MKQRTVLDAPDRWLVHLADDLSVNLNGMTIYINQRPKCLAHSQVGVGACLWDGSLVLAANLIGSSRNFMGSKCIELGAGVGFVSIVLAKLGSQVYATDLGKVLPLLCENVSRNGVDSRADSSGFVECMELNWSDAEIACKTQALVHTGYPDFVLAADCCYWDSIGAPSVDDFVGILVALCGPNTKILISQERRSEEIRQEFLCLINRNFGSIKRVSLAKSKMPPGLCLDYCDVWEISTPYSL